ncbi:hypothetical protein PFISCL1PPCAC_7286, partial [Pristionchus fissidentatus]
METPDLILGQFYSLSSTTTNIFNVQPSPSTAIRKLQPIIRDLRVLLSSSFCDDIDHVMDGVAYKRSAPLRHFFFWRRVKDCMRNAKKIKDAKLTTLVGNIEQKLLQSSSYAPRTPVLMYVQAAIVARLARLAQIRRAACAATDEMIGHMEKHHWLAFARFLIGLVADLSAKAKEDGERIVKIFDRLRVWIVENGNEEAAKSALFSCSSIADWWRDEAVIGNKSCKPDQAILRRLMVVSDNDVVATRVIQAMRNIEAEEKRKNDLFTDLGKSVAWNGEMMMGEEGGGGEKSSEAHVKQEIAESITDSPSPWKKAEKRKRKMVEDTIEPEVKQEEIEVEDLEEPSWTIDRGEEVKTEEDDDVIKKEEGEEGDDGWAEFAAEKARPESWKMKKKKKLLAGKRKSSTVDDEKSTVGHEDDRLMRKKKLKRKSVLEESIDEATVVMEPEKKKKKKKKNTVNNDQSIDLQAGGEK